MKAYIGLGANVGKRKKNMELALQELRRVVKITRVSSLYESAPWGYPHQEKFLNAVVEIETNEEPLKLLSLLKGIESRIGRKKTFKWGPRVIDLDILFYDSWIVDSPKLKIPHPEIKTRAFVLVPLLELNESITYPENEKQLKDIVDISSLLGNQNIRKIATFNVRTWRWDETV